MSFLNILYTLLIGPLEYMFAAIYGMAFKMFHNPGLSIITLSMAMNFLLLPMYRRTDILQEEAIATEKKMKPYVSHFKKTFSGDERFMVLQTCYRQHHYKPTDAIKGLAPLVIEIPFFMAAYNFLSSLESLHYVPFGPIGDLGAPDGMIHIGALTLNLLPILMTAINIISSAIYTKEAPMKTKVQLYGMAGLFLVLLYQSPAGLVFYWTLNNLFSLVKNAVMKTKNPMKTLAVVMTPISIMCILFLFVHPMGILRSGIIFMFAVMLNIPFMLYLHKKKKKPLLKECNKVIVTRMDYASFFLGATAMTLLLGAMIPSSLIHSSPEEFINMELQTNPNVIYVLNTFFLMAGLFIIWMGLFFVLANSTWKRYMEMGIWSLFGIAIVNYMFFGRDYGNLSSQLVFDEMFANSRKTMLLNLMILMIVILVIVFMFWKKAQIFITIGIAIVITMIGMSGFNIIESQRTITSKIEQLKETGSSGHELFHLSKSGKNVVILMMDRAIGAYVPYLFHEDKNLQEQFAGFTYYPNVVSYGGHTNFGLPAVFGGYEYTPVEMNKRDTEALRDKHNEAMRVLPELFDDHDYHVSVCNPTYVGYGWIPDLTIYAEHPEIETHLTVGKYNDKKFNNESLLKHNMFFYAMMKVCPVIAQPSIYNEGQYFLSEVPSIQTYEKNLVAQGWPSGFEDHYSVLEKLPKLTAVEEVKENTFQMLCNDTTHAPVLLQMPDYEPKDSVDNTAYDEEIPIREDASGNKIVLDNHVKIKHYHANMAAYKKIGEWLNYLRENDVYDNTKIIIVSDHGFEVGTIMEKEIDQNMTDDLSYFNPLLLVKDFNSTEFKTDETFMTNADVPTLAVKDLIPDARNPFTQKVISSEDKLQRPLYITDSHQWSTEENNGNVFHEDYWLAFQGDNIKDEESWQYAGFGTFPEQKMENNGK